MPASFSARALRNIVEIFRYIAKDDPIAAGVVRDRIFTVADLVAEYPQLGHDTCVHGIRVAPVSPYPYLVFFRHVRAERCVRILRVRHAARRPLYVNEPAREFAL